MANEIIAKTDTLDFDYFISEAFSKQQVVDWVLDHHEAYTEQDTGQTERIISLGLFARQNRRLHAAGRIGRLIHGDIVSPTLGFNRTDLLHDLFEKHSGDYDLEELFEWIDGVCKKEC